MCDIDYEYQSPFYLLIEPHRNIPIPTIEVVLSVETRKETRHPTFEWYSNTQSTFLPPHFQQLYESFNGQEFIWHLVSTGTNNWDW